MQSHSLGDSLQEVRGQNRQAPAPPQAVLSPNHGCHQHPPPSYSGNLFSKGAQVHSRWQPVFKQVWFSAWKEVWTSVLLSWLLFLNLQEGAPLCTHYFWTLKNTLILHLAVSASCCCSCSLHPVFSIRITIIVSASWWDPDTPTNYQPRHIVL